MGANPLVQNPQCLLWLTRTNGIRFGKKKTACAVSIQKIRIQSCGDFEESRKVLIADGPFVRFIPSTIILNDPHPVKIRQDAVVAQRHLLHDGRRAEVKQIGLLRGFAQTQLQAVLRRFDQGCADQKYATTTPDGP